MPVYASDLARTIETAIILDSHLDDRSASSQLAPALREFSYGAWEGLTLAEVQVNDPNHLARYLTQNRAALAAPDGETTSDVHKRVRRFFDDTRTRHRPGGNALVAGHGGSIRALAMCLLDLANSHFWRSGTNLASLSIARDFGDAAILDLWNDTSHLNYLYMGDMIGDE